MKLSHDDKLRALRAAGALPKTCSDSEQVSDQPVQLTRPMIDAAILRSAQTPVAQAMIAARRGKPSRQTLLPPGRVASFLRTAQTLQRLPSFTNRRE